MAESAAFKPAPESSDHIAVAPRADEPPASVQASRPRPAGGLLRPSQVPVPGETTRPTGSSSPAGGRAYPGLQRWRPSGAPAGAALPLARPSAVPARPIQDVLRGSGQPLAAPVREEMEARLGADFSDVRVHTGEAARASAAGVGARACTSGDHVVIGEGGADKHTLAHELTHVIQQRQGPVAGTDHGSGFKVSDPFDVYEKAAEANAARVMARASGSVQRSADRPGGGSGALVVQRVEAPPTFRDFLTENSGKFSDVHDAFGQYWDDFSDDLLEQGVDYNTFFETAETDWKAVEAERETAQAEQQRAQQARQNSFRSNDPGTWMMSGNIHYGSKIRTKDFGPADLTVLGRIATHREGIRESRIVIGNPLHAHLTSGTEGVGFVYFVEEDWRVGILVHAYSSNRLGNKYEWDRYSGPAIARAPDVPAEDTGKGTVIGDSPLRVAQLGQGGSSSSHRRS